MEDAWCSAHTTVTAAAPPTTFTWNPTCESTWGDGNIITQSFDPPQFTSPACTDSGNVWSYSLDKPANLDPSKFKIGIDGINNLISVEALGGGSGSDSFVFTATYTSPDGFSGSF